MLSGLEWNIELGPWKFCTQKSYTQQYKELRAKVHTFDTNATLQNKR